jgi:hypothetical protein
MKTFWDKKLLIHFIKQDHFKGMEKVCFHKWAQLTKLVRYLMEQHALKKVNNYFNINIYSYLETSVCQIFYLY